jgi:hypothetical protein
LLQWVTFLVDEDWTNTPPIVAPAIDSLGTIYHAAVHNLFAISSGGAVKWIFNPPGDPWSYARTPPVIAPDGTILAAFGTRVYALAGAHPPADTAWPMYRQNPRHTGKVERPSLQKAKETSDATFQFQLFGQISNTFTIEVSTNLPTWTALTSFVATNVPMGVVDSDATGSPVKFYRALQTQ